MKNRQRISIFTLVCFALCLSGCNQREVVNVTPACASKFQEYLSSRPSSYIVVEVTPGGCTGLMYNLRVDDNLPDPSYWIEKHDGYSIAFSPEDAVDLQGATIDWEVQDNGIAGFKFQNPNEIQFNAGG